MKPDDLILDDTFLAWYFRTDEAAFKKWEAVRETDPVAKGQMDEAVRMIKIMTAGEIPVLPEQQAAAHSRLMTRIDDWEQRRQFPRQLLGRRLRVWSGVAASVAVLVMVAYWLYPGKSDSYTTVAGESRRIELSDGSVVNLNGGSSLEVQLAKGKDRQVWLKGEAYFQVSKMENGRKFIVHTDDLNVEVLGTEFNVKGRAEKTVVVLESGKVQLSLGDQHGDKMLMKPGEKAEFSKESGKLTKQEVNTRVYTSWREGKVLFENAGVNEIAEILRDRYGLTVQVRNGSALGEFNGLFPADDKEIVLTALQKTYPGRIVRNDNSIQIK